jgi:hypothetical protein
MRSSSAQAFIPSGHIMPLSQTKSVTPMSSELQLKNASEIFRT